VNVDSSVNRRFQHRRGQQKAVRGHYECVDPGGADSFLRRCIAQRARLKNFETTLERKVLDRAGRDTQSTSNGAVRLREY
jgi:hypothetical protein